MLQIHYMYRNGRWSRWRESESKSDRFVGYNFGCKHCSAGKTNCTNLNKSKWFKCHLSWACWKMDSFVQLMMEMAKAMALKRKTSSDFQWKVGEAISERMSERATVALIVNIIIWNSLEIFGFACGIPQHTVTVKCAGCCPKNLCPTVSTIKNNVHFLWNIMY